MTNTKMTKKDYFNMVIDMTLGTEFTESQLADIQEFAKHEIDLLNRKHSTGKSKSNEKNEKYMEQILEALQSESEAVTVSTLLVRHAELIDEDKKMLMSNQKCSALLKKLVDSGKVVKEIEKKVSYFKAI